MASLTRPTESVPEWLLGVWERRYIRSAREPFAPSGDLELLGPENRGTTVRYLQTPRLFIDIRIPTQRTAAALPAGGLNSASAADLSELMGERKGSAFAGLTEVWQRDDGEERVHWHAAYNFFPPNDSATLWPQIDAGRHTTSDIGRVEHKEHGMRWFEWGTKQSTFVEEWVKVDDGSSGFLAVRRPGEMLLVVGDWFSYVRDVRDASIPSEPTRGGLAAFLEGDDATVDQKRSVVNAEYSNGQISNGWKISLSTLPWREGKTLDVASLFAPGAPADSWEQVGDVGQTIEATAASLLARASAPAGSTKL